VSLVQLSDQRRHASLSDGSSQMRAIRTIIENIADTDATVLIRGESGVGKDLVARAIHAGSSRRHEPFVKINCAAIPSGLIESELFGHEKGAFTGAHRRKPGQFEYADKGTIYLDEIGELRVPPLRERREEIPAALT
jgi:Nif-specific regulatory protein